MQMSIIRNIYGHTADAAKSQVSGPLIFVYTVQNDLDRELDINLDHDPEDAPVHTGHSLFNLTMRVTFVFIVLSLFDGQDGNPSNIWI